MEIELLSVIIPIYKKEGTIRNELIKIYNILKATPYNFEIIGVVDGTSLDDSFNQARSVNKHRIKIYGYKNNYGKGQAVRYGMQKSIGDVICFIDSGGDINPQGIVMLLEHMKWYKADIIVGNKLHSASKVNYPTSRRIFSWGYSKFVKVLFGLKIMDTQTGLKAYKRKVLDNVLDVLVVKRFAFDIEILAVAHSLGFQKIYDAPVDVNLDFEGSSIMGIFTKNGLWLFIYDTLAVWYRLRILRYYSPEKEKVRERKYNEDLEMHVNTGKINDENRALTEKIDKILATIKKSIGLSEK
jgi:glycosyltransferase involved in cell wall biosynthesis